MSAICSRQSSICQGVSLSTTLPGTSDNAAMVCLMLTVVITSVGVVVVTAEGCGAATRHAEHIMHIVHATKAMPIRGHACRLQRDLRQGLSLSSEVLHFAQQAQSMSAALKQRSLASLIAALPTRKHQLLQQSPGGQAHMASFLPEVEAATWRLV